MTHVEQGWFKQLRGSWVPAGIVAGIFFAPAYAEVASQAADTDDVSDAELAAAWQPSRTFASVGECVTAHIAAHGGRANAVRKLTCAAPVADCTVAPDLSALARVPNVRAADLSRRCIADTNALTALPKLKRLELAGNAIERIRPLGALGKLVYLGLADNPVLADWIFDNREPFSRLPKLEELVLDGTAIDNLMPLSHAPLLRVLSLRRMSSVVSLRPLVALPKLRILHVDDDAISDLRPLADMKQLEEFSADRTYVSSVAPLSRLVQRHRLRKVTLRGACASECTALNGAEYDCGEPQPADQCFVPEVVFQPHYSNFAVPVAQVERFAAPDLPVWTAQQLASAFQLARSAPDIRWDEARGNCDGRLYATIALLREQGFPGTGEAMSFGNLRMLAPNDPLGFLMFDWHFAVTVRVQDGTGTGLFVIDPALDFNEPMRLRDWFARQVDSAGSTLDFSCEPYWGNNAHLCAAARAVDANGNFIVDPLSSVLGTVCRDGICGK